MSRFQRARLKYKPDKIKYLLVAETPPKLGSDRFFYFESVNKQDSLFLESMKVLYPEKTNNIPTNVIRLRKREFLTKFKEDGFYLIDSLDQPFEEKYSQSQKVNLIKDGQKELLKKIKSIVDKKTKVILIAAPVFKANYEFLLQNGVNVINKESIDFPGSGGQKKFKEKIGKILR